ncbi:hypothetical protein NAPIS_ORF01560 [Vairimorpha apis BRL 01]|uniref:Uncharacterized protein n=1 Tax=Vairimorpha apis BRL 01 TaxID=1037528 RepID=T0L8P2_9MICR|nr:hypothetical protein NAPIS_ORF01560 [Vairimorpha apis BRL 01]
MNLIIIFVSTIFCTLQKLIEDDYNFTVTNKRKFINEQDTTLENTSINKHDESYNEESFINKQKCTDDQLENNNYKDLNYLKSHNFSIFEEFNDTDEISNDKFNNINESVIINKDEKFEKCSCDDANNFEKIFNMDDVCNNEDFNYYCSVFSLDLLDNIDHDNNTETNKISIYKEKEYRNDITLILNITHKVNDNVNKFFLNISNDDIKRYANSYCFTQIFDIIFQDLLNFLKISTLFTNIENEQLKNRLITLEEQINCEQKF